MIFVPVWTILSYYEAQTLSYHSLEISWMDVPRLCPLSLRH